MYVCMCAHPAEVLRAPLPRSSGKETGPKLSDILLVVLDSVSLLHFFPFSLSFPLFLSSFRCFYFSHRRGRGQEGQRILVVVAPAAPGAQSRRPPGAEQPLPGISRRWSRDLGISRSRDLLHRGELLKGERVCLDSASCRSLTFRSHGRGGDLRGPPGETGPWKGETPHPALSLFCPRLFALDKQV